MPSAVWLWLCAVTVCRGCVPWLCAVTVCCGCVLWLCTMAVVLAVFLWLRAVAMCCGCVVEVFWLCGGCVVPWYCACILAPCCGYGLADELSQCARKWTTVTVYDPILCTVLLGWFAMLDWWKKHILVTEMTQHLLNNLSLNMHHWMWLVFG